MSDSPEVPEDDAPGVPEWVVTYGDMMSLLLTFFIMLVSMSELKQDGKMRAMLDAVQERFGPSDGKSGVPGKANQELSANIYASSAGDRSDGGFEPDSRVSKGGGGPNLTVEKLNQNSVITLGGPAHFARFSAAVNPTLESRVKQIAAILVQKNFQIIVRGHASPEPLPPESEFSSPMDLSFARANAVASILLNSGIGVDRLHISAAGDSEPRTRSRKRADQEWNRRVDIFLADSYITPRAKSNDGQTDGGSSQ